MLLLVDNLANDVYDTIVDECSFVGGETNFFP